MTARTAGVHLRTEPEDVRILDQQDNEQRAQLIADRLKRWKTIISARGLSPARRVAGNSCDKVRPGVYDFTRVSSRISTCVPWLLLSVQGHDDGLGT